MNIHTERADLRHPVVQELVRGFQAHGALAEISLPPPLRQSRQVESVPVLQILADTSPQIAAAVQLKRSSSAAALHPRERVPRPMPAVQPKPEDTALVKQGPAISSRHTSPERGAPPPNWPRHLRQRHSEVLGSVPPAADSTSSLSVSSRPRTPPHVVAPRAGTPGRLVAMERDECAAVYAAERRARAKAAHQRRLEGMLR